MIEGCVTTVTIIKDLPVWSSIYGTITDTQSFGMLVRKARLLVSDLVGAN
jgi:hypothetical protein